MQLVGGDLAAVNATSLAACRAACRAVPACGALTYFFSLGKCFLKLPLGWARVTTVGAMSVALAACPRCAPLRWAGVRVFVWVV